MGRHLQAKVIAIAAVMTVFGSIGVYPIVAAHYGITSPSWLMAKELKLGLDLKGGVHLVLRLQADDALRLETDGETERLREELQSRNIPFTNIESTGPTQFKVEGVPQLQDAAFLQTSADMSATYDRIPGVNGTYTFKMKANVQASLRDAAVVHARETIERRVNELGVTEPSIALQGSNGDEMLVQLPGVSNVERAKSIIQSTGTLELKIVEDGPAPTREALIQNAQRARGTEIIPGVNDSAGSGTVYYLVRKTAAVTGRDLRNAQPRLDANNQPAVFFTLNSDGGRKFAKVTGENIGRQLAIVLDGRVQSTARIDDVITLDGVIHGRFTQAEAQDLSLILRSGALYTSLTYLEERTIGPSLGADSIRSGIIASIVGLLLVIAFMLVYYKWSGVNAIVAVLFNLIILLGLIAYVGAVMTLPGIAGFVLTMGIGVDSNVLIFERIKEEVQHGRGVRASINAGFSRVFLTLIDTHLAALISAAFLFQFGTGPIRGFAVTLTVGLLSNLFTSTFVSKTLFELVLARRRQTTMLSI
jgi:preprotein translocase subunit SecD